ncbi:ArsR family transcriptional regulator [Corynebacterium atypicum]|uniref:ArsR family transcriptional regulator n=1 Tax=Corynebacterium atypicum TaxID=191610 RepID=A0ABM5QPV3_9CORY|nr:metalloregulator ArsR/SmtB family transcription factor [Corynebacterium atypicum]AIG64745.1 ArsR family transcriptional regulator [Corynebacterium atypicum]
MVESGGVEDLLQQADSWARRFKMLGDPTRLRLLAIMHHRAPGTTTVSELAEFAQVRVPTASAALRAMEASGLVHGSRVGREVRYVLSDPEIHRILHDAGFSHDSYGHAAHWNAHKR